MKKIAKVGFVLLATGLLAACATKSKITPEGTTDEPRFLPDLQQRPRYIPDF